MEKFKNYLDIIIEVAGWKKPNSVVLDLCFLNDIDRIAQEYGYTTTRFGEHENKRVIMFEKSEKDK